MGFQTSLSFPAALELGLSLQIQLLFGSFVQPFTVSVRASSGEDKFRASPANLDSSTILLTLALLQGSPSPSGRVFLLAPPTSHHPQDVSPPSVMLLFVSSSTATTRFQLLLAALTGVAVCGLYLSPGWVFFFFLSLFLLYDP